MILFFRFSLKLRSFLSFSFLDPELCRRVFNKTIIVLGLAGYEMIITNSALRASLVMYHFISSAPSWNNCYIYIYKGVYIYCNEMDTVCSS